MTAQIIDLSTARLLRNIEALDSRNTALQGLARRQVTACREAHSGLVHLSSGLRGFCDRLEEHRRRCEAAAVRLRRASEALHSDDIDHMIAVRDDLQAHMDRQRRRQRVRR